MIENKSLKRALNLTGALLAAASIVFIAVRLSRYSSGIDFRQFEWATWLLIACIVVIYSVSNLLTASAWYFLLRKFGEMPSFSKAFIIFGTTQLAKYLPGNIFHFAGRQSMGMTAGMKTWSLAKSMFWEICLQAFSGGLFVVLVVPLLTPRVPYHAGTAVFAIAVTIAAMLIGKLFGRPVAVAFGCHVSSLLIAGFLFAALFVLTSGLPLRELPLIALCGAYVIAWLAGFATPGAPAGLGIRELVLLFILKGAFDESGLIMAVLLGRMVTIIGDLLIFTVAAALGVNIGKTATAVRSRLRGTLTGF